VVARVRHETWATIKTLFMRLGKPWSMESEASFQAMGEQFKDVPGG
jgi:hypothetical protein